MNTQEFLITFKQLIAQKGWPSKVYSDNGKTFVAEARVLKGIMHDKTYGSLTLAELHGGEVNRNDRFDLSQFD